MIIAPNVDLPDQVLHQHIAVVGKTGSGKTYTAKGVVEKLARAGRRVCIVDPTGVWWGLASRADGAAGDFPVAIFGGPRGHVPITEHAGEALGELVATSNLVSVIDLRDMLLSEQRRFVERFFEALYQHNTRPLHLVVDEADEFGPQQARPETARMLGQFDRIARRGRTRGFRLLVITQRPAKLNKDILGQAATLITQQLTLPHDRDAVKAWVADQADPAAGREVIGSLPKLKCGEGWVWCPDAELLQRTAFPAIETFDSSTTPDDEASPGVETVAFAEVDLTEIRRAMAASIEQAEDSDVDKLRAKVKRLTEERDRALRTPVSAAPEEVAQLRRQNAILEEKVAGVTRMGDIWNEAVAKLQERVTASVRLYEEACVGVVRRELGRLKGIAASPPPRDSGTYVARTRAAQAESRPVVDMATSELTGPQQRLIDAIAWWEMVGIPDPTRAQAGWIAGYTASSGTFRTLLSECKRLGLIEYVGTGQLELLGAGRGLAKSPAGPGSLAELHARVRERLAGPQQRVFDALTGEQHFAGSQASRASLAAIAGYEATSGTFRTLLSECRSLGLLIYPSKQTVQASCLLFPEGLT